MNTEALLTPAPSISVPVTAPRILSIDAMRGLVMFTMIFVNDLAGAPHAIVPWWMRHFKANGNGMTFVDLVFPAFLFIVGMSIPFALGSRLQKGEPLWKIILHVLTRTLSLLCIGILMVNGTPDSSQMGWSGSLWSTLMYGCAIFAFCSIKPRALSLADAKYERTYRLLSGLIRLAGGVGLLVLALAFRGLEGRRIITLVPFSIHTSWYGILGLIGWAYLVAAAVYLMFRHHRTALLGCMVLIFCLYPAAKTGAFDQFWLNHYVGIGSTLGSQAAITVAGLLLGSSLVASDITALWPRIKFALLFCLGCALGAMLLYGLYGINKNAATPSWCLWACAISTLLWVGFFFICDVQPVNFIARPLAIAGGNVLLAYLLSDLFPSAIELFRFDTWYANLAMPNLACTIARSVGCATVILLITTGLNRAGFWLKL